MIRVVVQDDHERVQDDHEEVQDDHEVRRSNMLIRRSKMIRVVVVMVNNMRMRSVIRWPNHRFGKV